MWGWVSLSMSPIGYSLFAYFNRASTVTSYPLPITILPDILVLGDSNQYTKNNNESANRYPLLIGISRGQLFAVCKITEAWPFTSTVVPVDKAWAFVPHC